ncbi:MAG: histidine kinase dimerization/phosphoacceptor domain -containing protein, partial [Bacteriovorax sp.]
LASFEFLTNVFNNSKENSYLFFIGAYRHNEVDSDHPLIQLLNKIKKEKYPIEEVYLGPITEEACNEMISYILDVPGIQTKKLASFLSLLTDGNPLFVSESLSYLYNEKIIRYIESKNEWTWDLEDLNQTAMPTTIVELFSSKLKKLSPTVIDLMDYCACMGNYFDPGDLAKIVGIQLLELFEVLRPALSQSLIIENKNQLQFVHDKVQEATLSGISLERREMIHWEIGNYLLAESHGDLKNLSIESIFSMASHFNIAAEISLKGNKKISSEQSLLICEVNFHAGNSALASLATNAANDYFNRALNLLPEQPWKSHYQLTYQLHIKLAKTELMVGRYATSEKLLTDLLNNAKSELDKIEALAEQTTSLSSIGNFIKAIETANKGLAYFDMDIPENSELARSKCEKIMAKIHGNNEDVWTKILGMPFSDDRRSKVELSFYSELIPDLYMSGMPEQLYLSAAQSTMNCLSGGMNESVIYAFSIMGLNLGEKEQFEQAFKYEDLAKNLVEKYPNTFGATRGINGVVWCNMHSRSTPDQIIAYCLKGIQSGKNCGDLYNAGLCYGPLMWNLQIKGDDFNKTELVADECLKFSKKFDLNFSIGLAESVLAGWIGPMMRNDAPVDMDEKIQKWKSENHIASIGSYYMHMGLSSYYFKRYDHAKNYFLEVEKYISGMTDNVLKRQWIIFKALNQIELYLQSENANERDLMDLNESLNIAVEKIKTWVALGPLLYPFFKFLLAKISRVNNGFEKSLGLHFEAISLANEMGYTFFEGFINESIGAELYKKQSKSSKLFIQEALSLYNHCHAKMKIVELESEYSEIVESLPSAEEKLNGEGKNLSEELFKPLPSFDLEYFLKSSAAIATEIHVDILVKKIVDVMMESSGAQLGLLVVLKDDELVIWAKNDLKKMDNYLEKDYPLEKEQDVSQAIVRYVYRSQQDVVLDNAVLEGEFVNDSDVQRLQLKSVLCLPLLSQSKTVGIIYLENRLVSSVFQSKQIKLTKLLSSQAAIALDNALLLDSMVLAKNKIKESLEEKEILLKEVNHRVKNNLQIISSLFNLQARKIKDKETIEIFKEAQNRIYSISLIHEKLFQSNSTGRINFKDYIEGLISNMTRSYGINTKAENSINLSIDVAEITVPLDVAVPLGIIINEVITNTLKYAFAKKKGSKEIRIQLSYKDNNRDVVELKIEDNGVGLPTNFDHEKMNGVGMTLIKNLSAQIQARYKCISDNGVKYNFLIPLGNEGESVG